MKDKFLIDNMIIYIEKKE